MRHPAQFAKRMIGSAAAVYAHNDPVMSACNSARSTDAEIRDILDRYNEAVIDQIVPIVEAEIRNGTADPIAADVRGLVRMLVGATALTLSGESLFTGPERTIAPRGRGAGEAVAARPVGRASAAAGA